MRISKSLVMPKGDCDHLVSVGWELFDFFMVFMKDNLKSFSFGSFIGLGSSEHSQSEDNAGIRWSVLQNLRKSWTISVYYLAKLFFVWSLDLHARPSVRRQSSRFKAVEPDGDSLAETDPIRTYPDGTVPSTSVDASAKIKDHATTRWQFFMQAT